VAGAAGLAVYAGLSADRLGTLLGTIAGVGVLVLALALATREAAFVSAGLVVLGGAYAGLFLVREGSVDTRAPLYGAGFFLVAELAFAALELRAGTAEHGLLARRAALVFALALGGIVLGAFTLATASIPIEGGLVLQAAGVAAAVTLGVALGRLAVRAR
jgi:hypothetical protein